MRITMALISLCSVVLLYATPTETAGMSAEQLLQRGVENYRAAKYEAAAADLNAAAKAFLAPQQMQNYVNTGKFENLDRLETALVYLSLAQSLLGREDEARESIQRLMTAERIEPTYGKLVLSTEAAAFETLVARLVPDARLAQSGATADLGRRPSAESAAAPQPQQAAVPQATPPPPPPEPTIAEERARIQKEADARIAAERESIQHAADERIALERANMQREIESRVAAERAAIEREAEARVVASLSQTRSTFMSRLREAEALAANDRLEEASEVYARMANAPDVPRDILAEAAVGLYRTSAFRQAATAFQKLRTFVRGEEDLRYYNAVVLYETGSFDDAKKELSCALPFIQVTDDVARYRAKIEQTPSRQALR